MKPLVNIVKRYRELNTIYESEQLDNLIDRLDLDKDDLTVQHRIRIQSFLNQAEMDYPSNKGLRDILDIVRRKSFGRHFVQREYEKLENLLSELVELALKESTVRPER